MELAGNQVDRKIDNREAKRAVVQGFDDALLDRRDVVARDRAADDAVLEREPGTARQRADLDRAVGKLTMTATLPLEARVLCCAFADRLLVGHRRMVSDDRQILPVAQSV